MTLVLSDKETKPADLEVKTGFSTNGTVHFGDYVVSMDDFLAAVEYVLTNTNLAPNDPRLQFVRRVGLMVEVSGWGGVGLRLEVPVPATHHGGIIF